MELKGKTAIVTGASRGIGKAIALEIAKEGCNLAVCARDGQRLAELKQEAEAYGVKCIIIVADLRHQEHINQAINQVFLEFGRIDILVNNAGVLTNDGVFGVTEESWDITMEVNLKAQFFMAQAALQKMKKNHEGYIINMSSTVALGAKPDITCYSISKYGVVGLSEALYQEAKKYQVKVSTIYPGVTDTEMLRAQTMPCDPSQWMLPEDIAGCVMFLLKSSGRMVIKDIVPWSTGYDQI